MAPAYIAFLLLSAKNNHICGDPYPSENCIHRDTIECFNMKMLFYPFEKQLNIPSFPIQIGVFSAYNWKLSDRNLYTTPALKSSYMTSLRVSEYLLDVLRPPVVSLDQRSVMPYEAIFLRSKISCTMLSFVLVTK